MFQKSFIYFRWKRRKKVSTPLHETTISHFEFENMNERLKCLSYHFILGRLASLHVRTAPSARRSVTGFRRF